METRLKPIYIYGLGLVIGAIAGYLYYRLVECSTGSCPLTSSPVATTLWGALLGGVIAGMFVQKKE